jgi:hypothetical protein
MRQTVPCPRCGVQIPMVARPLVVCCKACGTTWQAATHDKLLSRVAGERYFPAFAFGLRELADAATPVSR